MIGREEGRRVFDEVAALYDEARQSYPGQLIEDIVALSEIPSEGRILEIGSGTGKATVPFARRGYSMLCLEPGPRLAAIAKQRLSGQPKVHVEVVTFEDWRFEEGAFDLVIAADCWRWIAPEVGYSKSADAMKDTGALAIFRNTSPHVDSAFFRELDEAYRKHTPELAGDAPKTSTPYVVDWREREMNEMGLFRDIVVRQYPWSVEFDADRYIRLMGTYSDIRARPAAAREGLFDEVRDLIERHGGVFTKPYLTVLNLAKKRTD